MSCREKLVKTGLFSYGKTIFMRDKLWKYENKYEKYHT
jgi:hypothetical protein